jgi:hypothetical protein
MIFPPEVPRRLVALKHQPSPAPARPPDESSGGFVARSFRRRHAALRFSRTPAEFFYPKREFELALARCCD